MKTKFRSLLIIPAAFLMLFTTGCASTLYGCVAVLQVAYGFTTAVTDREEREMCDFVWVIPDPPLEVNDQPVPNPNFDYTYGSGTGGNNPDHNTKPVIDTHRENQSNQQDTSRRPFTRR